MADEKYMVIKDDDVHFSIYNPAAKGIIITLDKQEDAEQLKIWMETDDRYMILNNFFLDVAGKEKVLKAMGV